MLVRHGVGSVGTNGDVPGGVCGEIRSAPSVDSVEGGGERRRPVGGSRGGVWRRRDENAGAVAGEGVDGSINESESRHLLILLPSQLLINEFPRKRRKNENGEINF